MFESKEFMNTDVNNLGSGPSRISSFIFSLSSPALPNALFKDAIS